MKRMYLDGTTIVLDTPYNREEVEALKQGIKSARWDRVNKVWRINISETETALRFAEAWEIQVTDELSHIELPKYQFAESKITQTGDKLYINIPYDPVQIEALKTVTGVAWDTQTKQWVAPYTSANELITWANKFNIPVPPHIQENLNIEKQHENYSIALSQATDANLQVPDLQIELYPYQRAGVRYAAEKRRTFIADEMGLGKSIQAIATIQHTNNYPALIVAPASLTIDWQTKIMEGINGRTTQIIQGQKQTTIDPNADFTIISYNNLNHHKTTLANHGYKALILDESHYCKNPDAARTKAARHIASKIPDDGTILLLTGTPISNKPAEYASQLQIINQIDKFGGLWPFYKRYCNAYQDQWGHWNKDGAKNLDELQHKLRQHCYIRREKTQVLTDLPPITYNTITTQMPPKYQKQYNHALNNLLDWYTQQKEQLAIKEGKNPTAARIKAHFATQNYEQIIQLTALRLITAKAKIDTAIEWVQNANQQGEKIVIAAYHREIVQTLANHLGGLQIIGGQNPEKTEHDKHQFMTNPNHQNIVISITAAAHGHTLTAASNMLIIEPPWTPTTYRQAIARIHRIGQTKPAQIHNLIIPNTIDTHVYNKLQQKINKTDPAITTNPQLQQLINHLT